MLHDISYENDKQRRNRGVGKLMKVVSQLCIALTMILGLFGLLYNANAKSSINMDGFTLEDDAVLPLAIIADMDEKAKVDAKQSWESILSKGFIERSKGKYSVRWINKVKLSSSLNFAGRGMELSELVTFGARLLAPDDRTGLLFDISRGSAVPWVWLSALQGDAAPMKVEWATVKDGLLYVGGNGKEYCRKAARPQRTAEVSTPLDCSDQKPMWVASIESTGRIIHHDWSGRYASLRKHTGHGWPGWMLHEAVRWSDVHRRWFFAPRRASTEAYTSSGARVAGTNLLISTSEEFGDIQVASLGAKVPLRGFSSFAFVPGTGDRHLVALKTVETAELVESYFGVYDIEVVM